MLIPIKKLPFETNVMFSEEEKQRIERLKPNGGNYNCRQRCSMQKVCYTEL
jgi:hypothetical protein